MRSIYSRSHLFALNLVHRLPTMSCRERAVGPVVNDGTGSRSKTKQEPVSRQAPENHAGRKLFWVKDVTIERQLRECGSRRILATNNQELGI